MKPFIRLTPIILLFISLYSFHAISQEKVLIVTGTDATPPVLHAAGELARDIENVYGFLPSVSPVPKDNYRLIYVAPWDSNPARNILENAGIEKPGPEAFVLFSSGNNLIICGADKRGTLYGVYEYSRRFLGIDPYEYWTGKTPEKKDSFDIPADLKFIEKSPVFPLRGYFDNDDDMIANWQGKKLVIEFETWKEMIDSLARLRYNYIDLHDTLGRAEFWNWSYYLEKFPGYKTDLELIDRIIDYAHSKGMLVQVPMYLGWEFHHLPEDKFCLSKYHDDWMNVYEYYLTETPLGKADLFLQRPRDPWWDHGYKCAEEMENGINPGPLMTKMFNGLLELVDKYRPGGIVVCDLWAEGREMWKKNSFNPDARVQMMWADGGYANYSVWPEDFKGHSFGVYIHAGYYLNHVMQDPYPARIKEATMEAVRRGMTSSYFVNGQDFKHFILNMEACARAAWDPEGFDPDKFYVEWVSRYFGAEAAPAIIESLTELHEASDIAGGFTMISSNTQKIVSSLRYIGAEAVDMAPVDKGLEHAVESLRLAEEAAALVPPDALLAYDDQVLFPARIYLENLKLHKTVAETANAFAARMGGEVTGDDLETVKKNLETWKKRILPQLMKLRNMLDEGSSWKKWDGWTKVENFRKITPPPDPEDIKRIVRTLK